MLFQRTAAFAAIFSFVLGLPQTVETTNRRKAAKTIGYIDVSVATVRVEMELTYIVLRTC